MLTLRWMCLCGIYPHEDSRRFDSRLADTWRLLWGDHVEYLVFGSDGAVTTRVEVGSGYWTQLWRPSMTRVIPPSLGLKFSVWWLFHYSGVFRNRDYSVVLIGEGDKVVHRSCVVPAYFRWPFMKANDCQISSTWTHPDYRGQGLATSGLTRAMALCGKPDRRFWYVCRQANHASIAVCKKAGFTYVGRARRTRRMGSSLLGQLIINSAERSS